MASVAALTALLGGLLAVPTPLRLTADVADVYALSANPAALGYLNGFELRLLYGRADASNGFGIYSALPLWDRLVIGASIEADVDDNDVTRSGARVGFGWAGDRVAVGLSYGQSPTPDAKGSVDFGLSLRFARWLAGGVTVHDLAQHAQRREWNLGLAVRPWDRFTVSSEWRLTQDTPLNGDTLDIRFLATVEPIRGLTLGVGADLDARLFFNLGLSFGGIGIGSALNVDGDEAVVMAEMVFDAEPESALFEPSAVAVVELAGEMKPESSFSLLRGSTVYPYGDVPIMLDALAQNSKVTGVFARIGSIDVGWGKAVEVRRALAALRTSGRRVDCQLFGRGDIAYFLATACTSVIVSPPQMLEVNGIAADVLFFGEALDRLGVHVEVVRRGEYKSSPEQLTRSGMSRAHREALGAYMDTVYDELVDAIAEGRKLEKTEVVRLLDEGTLTSSEAVAAKLVDERLYPDEVDEYLRRHHKTTRFVPAESMVEKRPTIWTNRHGIAVIHIDATITGGTSSDMPFGFGRTAGARTIIAAIEAARQRADIKAVVLRVDSPGGDAVASDLIARAVRKLAETKPVIASFGDVAASGGYYVAADARTIFAERTTLTGSIGVFSMAFSIESLLASLGIHSSVVGRGAHANDGSTYTDPDDAARVLIAKGVDDAYRMFLDVVATGRKMKPEVLREVAEGRIWSGRDAKRNGLVDELGGLSDAIRAAKLAAGFEEDDQIAIVTLPGNREPLLEPIRTIVGAFNPEAPPSAASLLLSPDVTRLIGAMYAPFADGQGARTLALSPWVVTVR